jgi:NAD(P)-dependent dehydrogenase (short-subunit alcohol dehydrogenase family)
MKQMNTGGLFQPYQSMLPNSCEPLNPEKFPENCPSLVILIFGTFSSDQFEDRGEWNIVDAALARGDRVMVARTSPASDPRRTNLDSYNEIECAVQSHESVENAVARCVQIYRQIDVVINWVDVGFDSYELGQKLLSGAASNPPSKLQLQLEEQEIARLMDRNALALFNILKAVLSKMRESAPISVSRKIFSISSTLGIVGAPGFAAYSASRWACEGMMESVGYEVQDQGIRTSIIDLGMQAPRTNSSNGAKLGVLMWELAHCQNPPLRFAFGTQAIKSVKDKLRSVVEEIEDWKYLFDE